MDFVLGFAIQNGLAGNRLVRRAVEAMLRSQARQHLVKFDHHNAARCQARILRGLVHKARATAFGRSHDFHRIRTAADFRRLVPLSTGGEAEGDHGSGSENRERCRRAALTALAFANRLRRPTAFVLVRMADPGLAADVTLNLSWFYRPFVRFGSDKGMSPNAAVALDAIWRSEAPIALHDPRHGLLRLLADHGVYFEFVPIAEVGGLRPSRHTVGEIEPGAPYVIAVTSAGGVWARLTDITVCFERRDPPLLQLVARGATEILPVTTPESLSHPLATPPLHRQSAGTPAAHPETLVHSPWSTPVDPG
jgi:hypothetical protein